jgi:GntR family phosphonate transport system transcriptional regulator/GntR family transcriptional regulator
VSESLTYLSVASRIEAAIRSLDLGARCPSENDVVREYGVSRPTARAALQELERRFVVRRVRGSGTFVNQRIEYRIGNDYAPSASETFARVGIRARSRVVSVSDIEARTEETRLCPELASSSLCRISRSLLIDEDVVGFGVSSIRHSVAPGVRQHIKDYTSIRRLLATVYGIDLKRRSISVTLDIPPSSVSQIIETREPCWHLVGVNVDDTTKEVVELGESWMRADRISVVVSFDDTISSRALGEDSAEHEIIQQRNTV